MTSLSLSLPVVGNPNSTEAPKIVTDFTSIQTWANGSIDASNLSAAAAQAATMNQSGQTVKGAAIIGTSQATSSTSFTTLATPDQVTGLILPSPGLFMVAYQATWSSTVGSAGSAAIFLGSNAAVIAASGAAIVPAASTSSSAGTVSSLTTRAQGLEGSTNTGYTGDVTTGQIVGESTAGGGVCYIFAAAGTYTVSIQFLATSGTLTVSNRRLYVLALSFA